MASACRTRRTVGTLRRNGGIMNRPAVWKHRVFAVAVLLPLAALAAEPTQELDEVLVRGERLKPNRDPQQIVNWLKLLVGQFRYTGYVEISAEGVPRAALQVRGRADCIAFGLAPGVICTINVSWPEVHGPDGEEVPGGVSALAPAMIQYGLDTDRFAIRYMQVDNEGLADRGVGYLVGDSLTTTIGKLPADFAHHPPGGRPHHRDAGGSRARLRAHRALPVRDAPCG